MLKNMRTGNKLKLLVLITIVVQMILGVAGIYGMHRINTSQGIMHQMADNIRNVEIIVDNILEIRLQIRNATIHINEPQIWRQSFETITQAEYNIEEIADTLQVNLYSSNTREALIDLTNHYYKLKQERNEFKINIENNNYNGALQWLSDNSAEYEKLQQMCHNLSAMSMDVINQTNKTDTTLSHFLILVVFVILLAGIISEVAIGWRITRLISGPINKLKASVEKLAIGSVDIDIDIHTRDEIGELADSVREVVQENVSQAQILHAVANGYYTVDINLRSEEDLINQSINHLIEKGSQMISEVSHVSQEVYSSAQQLSDVSQNLASGANQQAASVEQFTGYIKDIFNQTVSNANYATTSYDLIEQVNDFMKESTQYMLILRNSMKEVVTSAQKVAKISKVIEDIAFQTNILALNAAVEAGRAGHEGKGFAIVAEEVRTLSFRSAEAAKETAELVTDSLRQIEESNTVLEHTGKSLESASVLAKQSLDSMEAITTASTQQKEALNEINAQIDQISMIVTETSSTAEETAAAAEEMATQSSRLQYLINQFYLKEETGLLYDTNHSKSKPMDKYI